MVIRRLGLITSRPQDQKRVHGVHLIHIYTHSHTPHGGGCGAEVCTTVRNKDRGMDRYLKNKHTALPLQSPAYTTLFSLDYPHTTTAPPSSSCHDTAAAQPEEKIKKNERRKQGREKNERGKKMSVGIILFSLLPSPRGFHQHKIPAV